MRANRLLFALAFSLVIAGCGWSDSDTSANPRPRGGPRPEEPKSEQSTKPNIELGRGPVAQAQPTNAVLKAPPKELPAEAEAAEPEKEKRDLSRELRTAVGMPTDCLRPRTGADAPPKVTVDIEAHLVETGLVTRAYVRSGQLDAQELECIQKRVAAVRLQSPVEETPRAVSATLEFKFAAPKAP